MRAPLSALRYGPKKGTRGVVVQLVVMSYAMSVLDSIAPSPEAAGGPALDEDDAPGLGGGD